jgi:anti-sigma B factor antagonist
MRTSFEKHGGVLVARPQTPTLDIGNAGALKKALVEAAGEGPTDIVIDLSSVEQIDSSALGALVAVLKGVRTAGGRLRLCSVRPEVREILSMTMIDSLLPLSDDLTGALSALADTERAHPTPPARRR